MSDEVRAEDRGRGTVAKNGAPRTAGFWENVPLLPDYFRVVTRLRQTELSGPVEPTPTPSAKSHAYSRHESARAGGARRCQRARERRFARERRDADA